MCNCEEIERIKKRIARYEEEIADSDFDIQYFGYRYPEEIKRDRTDRIARLKKQLKTLTPCAAECAYQAGKRRREAEERQREEQREAAIQLLAELNAFVPAVEDRLRAMEANLKELNEINYDPAE